MNNPNLIAALRGRGYKLEADGGNLKVTAPKLDDKQREFIRRNKDDILLELTQEVQNTAQVVRLFRERFGPGGEPAPAPPPQRGCDPLVHGDTDKARFFREGRPT